MCLSFAVSRLPFAVARSADSSANGEQPTANELVMTRRATGQTLNLVFLHQPRSQLFLLVRDIGHVEHLVARADVILRIAVAVEAPLHGQRSGLIGQRHLIDAAVAR